MKSGNKLNLEPFYLYPLDGDKLKYFIGREKELDYVIKEIKVSNGEILSVCGSIGSGKTSFLNMVRERYSQSVDSSEIKLYLVSDFMRMDKPEKGVNIYLVDDVAQLGDDKALEFYRKTYRFVSDNLIDVIFTDKKKRKKEVDDYRDWLITGRILRMNLRIKNVTNLMKERFKIGGVNVFSDEALMDIAFRTGSNLREFLKYSKEAYIEKNGVKVEREDVVNIIKEIDEEKIGDMDEVSKSIIKVLTTKCEKGGSLNASMLLKYVRDELGQNISRSTFYEYLKTLIENRFILTRRVGKEVVFKSIHKLLGIEINIEELEREPEMEL